MNVKNIQIQILLWSLSSVELMGYTYIVTDCLITFAWPFVYKGKPNDK